VPEHLSHSSCPLRHACIGKLLHSGSCWCSIAPHGRFGSQRASMSCNEPSERLLAFSVASESYRDDILIFNLEQHQPTVVPATDTGRIIDYQALFATELANCESGRK
jgi:hypothetical protein